MKFLNVLLMLLPFSPRVLGLVCSLILRFGIWIVAIIIVRKPALKDVWKFKSNNFKSFASFVLGFFGLSIIFVDKNESEADDSKRLPKLEVTLEKINFRSVRWNFTSLSFQGVEMELRSILFIAESSKRKEHSQLCDINVQRLETLASLKIDEIKLNISFLDFFRKNKQQNDSDKGKKLTGIFQKITILSRLNTGLQIKGLVFYCETSISSTNATTQVESNSHWKASFILNELSLSSKLQKGTNEISAVAVNIPLMIQGITIRSSSSILEDDHDISTNTTLGDSRDPLSLEMQSTIMHFTLYPYSKEAYATVINTGSSNNKRIILRSQTNLDQLSDVRFVLVDRIIPALKTFVNEKKNIETDSKKVTKIQKKNKVEKDIISQVTVDISIVVNFFIEGLEHKYDKSLRNDLSLKVGTDVLINYSTKGEEILTMGKSQIQEKLDPTFYMYHAVDSKSTRILLEDTSKLAIDLRKTFVQQINDAEDNILFIDHSAYIISKKILKSHTWDETKSTTNNYNTSIETSQEHLSIILLKATIDKVILTSDAITVDTLASSAALLKNKLVPSSSSKHSDVKTKVKKHSTVSHIDISMPIVTIALELRPFGKDEIEYNPLMCLAKNEKSKSLSLNTEYNADVKDLRVCLYSPIPKSKSIFFTFLNGKKNLCRDGMAHFRATQIAASVLFTPSIKLPEICSNDKSDEGIIGDKKSDSDNRMKRITFWVTSTKFDTEIEFPNTSPAGTSRLEDETNTEPFGPKLSVKLEAVVLGENVAIERGIPIQENIIINCPGVLCFKLAGIKYEDLSLLQQMGKDGIFTTTIVNHIDIQTISPTLHVTWSPIFMWFLMSVLQRTECAIKHYESFFSAKTTKIKTKRLLTNIAIKSNSTSVRVRAILSKGSIIDLVTENFQFNITSSRKIFWNKPNILLKTGKTAVSFHGNNKKILELSSLIFNNSFSIAPDGITIDYLHKKGKGEEKGIELTEEIMTDGLDRPILETFEILLGDSAVLTLPHDFHLGEIIDDATKTTKVMFLGMNIGKLKQQSTRPSIQKYQLMDIRVKIPFLDGIFLEDLGVNHKIELSSHDRELSSNIIGNQMDLNQSRTQSGSAHDALMLDRWRVTIVEAEFLIKRHTPPHTTQTILNGLDEDKGQIHAYGPRVEGGQISFSVKQILSVLHPLNMASPLAVVKNAKINGLLHIVPLIQSTKGVLAGRMVQETVKCHHGKCLPVGSSSDLKNSAIKSYMHLSSTEKKSCHCNYGVRYESSAIPPKIYINLEIDFNDLVVNYGMVLSDSIARLQDIIKRLIPPSSESQEQNEKTPPPLTWWDNLRFQFHGNFSLKLRSLSFRWLLDNPDQYDWSILLTSKNSCFDHSTGIFNVSMEDVIISVPGSSYHMLKFDESSGSEKSEDILHRDSDHCVKERHSLMLVPHLTLNTNFSWSIASPQNTKSSEHHQPYLLYPEELRIDGTYSNQSRRWDKFERFRSCGVKLSVDLSCSHNSTFATWLALRVDVLPWLVHKGSSSATTTKESSEGEPLPKILGLKFKASMSNLKIGAWLDEYNEMNLTESLKNSDTIIDGICLIVPETSASISNEGKEIKLKGPIQAALLNILDDPFTDEVHTNASEHKFSADNIDIDQSFARSFGVTDLHKMRFLTEENDQICIGSDDEYSHANVHNMNSYKSFECLQYWSTHITDYHYLLEVESIDIMDESLDDIKTRVCHDLSSGEMLLTEGSCDTALFGGGKKDTPWTVLVLGMKLLWSVDIRNSVMSIVQDLLFTINFMKVNVRGTPQNIAKAPGAITIKDDIEEDPDESSDNEIENVNIDVDNECIEAVSIPIDEQSSRSARNNAKLVSSLNYLLESNRSLTHSEGANISLRQSSSQESDHIHAQEKKPASLDGTSSSSTNVLNSDNDSQSSIEPSISLINDMIPTLNIHLANSQIQLYSESTGGSIVLAIRGAYVEQHKFTRLFTATSSSEEKGVSAESLLWRTRNEYTLEKMEIYSMCTDIDVSAGLQWLELGQIRKISKPILVRTEGTLLDNESETDLVVDQQKKVSKLFPQHFEKYEPRDFIVPQLFEKIMNPCTFKTREECHRPPIDLTKEELADSLRKGPPLFLNGDHDLAFDGALDHIDILIDELSFCLNSYQFSTTLDLIRNVLLEPPKPPRQRYYNSLQSSETTKKKDVLRPKPNEHAASALDRATREWHDKNSRQVKGKRGRKFLSRCARDLLLELEAHHMEIKDPIIRRIEYTLSKAKWNMSCQDIGKDDVEVNLTGFKGQHDFPTDGSVLSEISLEDFRISSLMPNEEAICFPDPTAIITTHIGVDLSPCQRCGCAFDRSQNENNSCVFHPGVFVHLPGESSAQWTCCHKMWKDAPGCLSRPHTGMERAIALSLESLPRKVDGVTMYRHIEANIYPGVTHTLVIQVTKSLCTFFMAYFLGDNDSSSNKNSHVGSLESIQDDAISSSSAIEISLQDYDSISTDASDKRKLLLGQQTRGSSIRSLASTSTIDNDNAMTDAKPSEKASNEVQSELIFVKRLRVGDINVDVSVGGGFHKFIKDTANVRIAVPAFQNAYKTGPANYFGKKYVKFSSQKVLKSFLKGNMFGKASVVNENLTHDNGDDIDKGSDNEHEITRSGLLLGLPATRFTLRKKGS